MLDFGVWGGVYRWATLGDNGGQASAKHKQGQSILGRDLAAPLTVQVKPGDLLPGDFGKGPTGGEAGLSRAQLKKTHWEVGVGQGSCLSIRERLRDKGRVRQEGRGLDIML